jgi:hypothetical protein
VVEDGVVPTVGVSALGVGRGLVVFPEIAVDRESGGWKDVTNGVLGGRGGNEDEAATAFSVASSLAGEVTIFKTPGVGRFSAALVRGWEAEAVLDEAGGGFFAIVDDGVVLTGGIVLVDKAAGVGFILLLSRAGKSSDWRVACGACEAIVLDRPLLPAKAFTSCFACAVDISGTLEYTVLWVGVGGPGLSTSGVPALGTEEKLRDGVNGADVGTIRDGTFTVVASAKTGSGWPWGSARPGGPKPGGTDGVEARNPNPKGSRVGTPMSSLVLSATNASTFDDASSRNGRSWSSIGEHTLAFCFTESSGA